MEPISSTLVIQSKKIQINSINHPLLQHFLKVTSQPQLLQKITKLKLEGNSYSKEVCQYLGKVLGSPHNHIIELDINDIFVSRLKEEIPLSIQYIAKGLIKSPLLKLDISNNAVNPYGAKALLNYLETASQLQMLLIANCGLGPLGVAEIAKGLKGTPKLQILSIGRNRIQNQGILYVAQVIESVPMLRQLYIYQNTLRKQGLTKLFANLRKGCKNLQSFDLCDNFVREQATLEMAALIKENKNLKNLNLSDCLVEKQNQLIIKTFEETQNRSFQKLGFNFIELNGDLALRLLQVIKQCPMKRLDIVGNDFPKSVKKEYNEVYKGSNILSKYEDDEDDEEEITRLFEQLKL